MCFLFALALICSLIFLQLPPGAFTLGCRSGRGNDSVFYEAFPPNIKKQGKPPKKADAVLDPENFPTCRFYIFLYFVSNIAGFYRNPCDKTATAPIPFRRTSSTTCVRWWPRRAPSARCAGTAV